MCVSKILGGRPHGEKGSESSGLVDNSTPPIWPCVRPLGVVVKCPVRRLLTSGLLVSSFLSLETAWGRRQCRGEGALVLLETKKLKPGAIW